MELVESAIRLSTPLLLAALGGVLSERVGVVNIALESMLLAGAFAAMAAAGTTENPWVAVAAAALAGLLIGLLHTFLVLQLRVDAIISGVGLNLLAVSATTFLLRSFFMKGGVGVQVHGPAAWSPALKSIPILGSLLGGGTPFVPIAILAVFWGWLVMYRTRWGLQLRAVGESTHAARAAGVRVERLRYHWVGLGGAFVGIGGAYLSLEAAGRFTENLSAGKGYLALAAVILGRWSPLGASVAVVGFGFAEALQIWLQGHPIGGVSIPSELLSAFPYMLGLLAVGGLLGRSTPPAALGKVD